MLFMMLYDLNQLNQVVFLEGLYQGEECIIQGWQEVKQQLYLNSRLHQ